MSVESGAPKVESVSRYVAKVPVHGVIGELLQWKLYWELWCRSPAPVKNPNPKRMLPKIQQHQAAESYKAPQYDSIPPLLRPYAPNQPINSRNLTRRSYNPPINTCQGFPLHAEALIDRISLIDNTVDDAMAVVYSSALLQHIFRLSFRRIGRAVGIDVRADVGKQVLAVAGFGYRRA